VDTSRLGYDTVSLGEWFLKFERTVGPVHSDKQKGTTVFLNIGNHLPTDTASHRRRLITSNRGITNSLRSCQQFKQTCYRSTCFCYVIIKHSYYSIPMPVQSNSRNTSRGLLFSNLLLLFLLHCSICIFGCIGSTSIHAIHVI